MILATSIHGSGLTWDDEYEPVTDSSREIHHTWAQKRNYLQGSASDWLPPAVAALGTIKNECGSGNWDGTDAAPVRETTIEVAAKVLETLFTMLPKGTPMPDVIPEADGEICISWSVDVNHLFALSIGDHGKINFSGQFGKEGAIHAWQPLDATSRSGLEKSLQEAARYIGRLYPVATIKRSAR